MKNQTLMDKSIQNLECAKILFNNVKNDDEVYLNYVGYHLQQAVELLIKYVLESNGVAFPKVHDISQLYIILKENGLNEYINNYVYEHSEMFSEWESKTRYVLNYKLEINKVKKALEEVEKYINECNKK